MIDMTPLEKLLANRMRLPLRAYYAKLNKLPIDVAREAARQRIERSLRLQKVTPDPKPRITVRKYRGKPLLTYRFGRYYQSAFTWDALVRKLAFGQYKRIEH